MAPISPRAWLQAHVILLGNLHILCWTKEQGPTDDEIILLNDPRMSRMTLFLKEHFWLYALPRTLYAQRRPGCEWPGGSRVG